MADDEEKERSADRILQAFDALSHLSRARANLRATSLPRSAVGSAKDDGSDDAAAVKVARSPRPQHQRRLSLTLPSSWSKPNKLVRNHEKDDDDDDEEEGGEDDAALVIIIKNQGLSAYEARPRPRRRRRVPPMLLTLRSRSSKKEEYDDEEEDEDDDESDDDGSAAPLIKSMVGPIRRVDVVGKWRRMGCLFSVEVVAARGLPPSMDGLRVAVTFRRKETRDGAVRTAPARVRMGGAAFDEAFYIRCHLYGTGGGNKPLRLQPRPFLVSLVAIHAPELDLGRSAVDVSLFAMEFADKYRQGECVRHWDLVFPLAGKAKGGELLTKLALQSIDDGTAAGSYSQPARKLRRSSVSSMLTPKAATTPTKKIKMGGVLAAPDLRGIDSFMLDDEADEPDELTPMAEVVKEAQQKEQERDEHIRMAEVKEEEQESEPANESTLVGELEVVEQQKEAEPEPVNEFTPASEVSEEEQQKVLEREPADEPTAEMEVKEEEPHQKEPECEPTLEVKVKEEEQQKELECEPTDGPTPMAEESEDEQHNGPQCEPADEPTLEAMVREEEQQKESECEPTQESTSVTEVEDNECDPTNVQEDNDSKLPEFDMIDEVAEELEVRAELEEKDEVSKEIQEEEVDAKKEFKEDEALFVNGGEVPKMVANGLEEKSVQATMTSDMSDVNVVADATEPVDDEVERPEEVIGAAGKPRRQRRFGWRIVVLLVTPVAVIVGRTLTAKR